jgi:hypothetical protein
MWTACTSRKHEACRRHTRSAGIFTTHVGLFWLVLSNRQAHVHNICVCTYLSPLAEPQDPDGMMASVADFGLSRALALGQVGCAAGWCTLGSVSALSCFKPAARLCQGLCQHQKNSSATWQCVPGKTRLLPCCLWCCVLLCLAESPEHPAIRHSHTHVSDMPAAAVTCHSRGCMCSWACPGQPALVSATGTAVGFAIAHSLAAD